MHAAAERLEFAPPASPGLLRAFVLALLAHALLLAGLTLGVQWRREAPRLSAEAELWSAIPEQAAPALQEPESHPPEPVQPVAAPQPIQPPRVDIALEQEKKRRLKQQQLELELRQEKLRQEHRKAEQLKKDQAEKLKQAEKAKKDALEKKRQEQENKKLEEQRQTHLKRIAGLAGASGATQSSATAQQASGPSASYAGRIRARIKPNIVFTQEIAGNPGTEVEVRTAPDGTIVGRKITQSSANKAWDDAVLNAIDKTEVLPRDTDGRVPATLIITFKPKD